MLKVTLDTNVLISGTFPRENPEGAPLAIFPAGKMRTVSLPNFCHCKKGRIFHQENRAAKLLPHF
jgi:hypothetical protein